MDDATTQLITMTRRDADRGQRLVSHATKANAHHGLRAANKSLLSCTGHDQTELQQDPQRKTAFKHRPMFEHRGAQTRSANRMTKRTEDLLMVFMTLNISHNKEFVFLVAPRTLCNTMETNEFRCIGHVAQYIPVVSCV